MNDTSLIFKTTYDDCLADYKKTLDNSLSTWDYVVLTASNESQAKYFSEQINDRIYRGKLPKSSKYLVVADENNERVGSGGATLSVIRKIHEFESSFDDLKILVIHSGGDSKRVPQYSAVGKIFSPVPRLLSDNRLSTLFDEFIISMSTLASRIKAGMLLLSGDALLLFNPLQVHFDYSGASCISFKEKSIIGTKHGVFLTDENNYVKQCLQKWTIEKLATVGAIDKNGMVNIDTGAIFFSSDILCNLYSLIDSDNKYYKFVNNKTRLSLYTDFLYPLAKNSTLDGFYNEKAEGDLCDELIQARKEIWDKLHNFNLKLIHLSPAKFLHFGTSREILTLLNKNIRTYKELGWRKNVGCSSNKTPGYNSIVSPMAEIGKHSYIECSRVDRNSIIGDNSIISCVHVNDKIIPSNVVVHGLKLLNGKYVVRIFGVDDNPKENKLFNSNIKDSFLNVDIELWSASIYPVKESLEEALESSLNFYNLYNSKKGDICKYLNEEKISLAESFNISDKLFIIKYNKELEELVKIDFLLNCSTNNTPVDKVNNIFSENKLSDLQLLYIKRIENEIDSKTKIRFFYYLGKAFCNETFINKSFKEISQSIIKSGTAKSFDNEKIIGIKKENVTVKLPLRINFAGGWSDTPPYPFDNGGSVINASIVIDNKMPVEASVTKISECKIIIESPDASSYAEFVDIRNLQNVGDPYDDFVLQKSALIALGIIPPSGGNLIDILANFGGGFKIKTQAINIPKGSGLGTSSILLLALIKAFCSFFGILYNDDFLLRKVMLAEQIMSTGGGWQDQAGAISNGIKYITSSPGEKQVLSIEHINVNSKTLNELNNRLVLIYTGERRLARHLLRNVIGNYIGNDKKTINALLKTKMLANNMKNALKNNDVDEFIKLCDEQYITSLALNDKSVDRLITDIFKTINDLIDAKIIVGAGGGGFIAAFLKKNVTKEIVQNRLNEAYTTYPIKIWDCQII